MARFTVILIWMVFVLQAQATYQEGDELAFGGKDSFVSGFVLNRALSEQVKSFLADHPALNGQGTSNHDSYFAKIELREVKVDGGFETRLFLRRLLMGSYESFSSSQEEEKVTHLVEVDLPEAGMWAKWFTGELKDFGSSLMVSPRTKGLKRTFKVEDGVLRRIEMNPRTNQGK